MLSMIIAMLLGSVFIPIRKKNPISEAEITSMLSTIFISFIIIGVLSITSVLPVMLSIRDMYYRHKAAGMLDGRSVGRALATAEKWFIILSSLLFCFVFIPCSGIFTDPDRTLNARFKEGVVFWGFFAFNTAIYSYIGRYLSCLVNFHPVYKSFSTELCGFAPCSLFLRPTFHVFGQGDWDSANFSQLLHWNQQFFLWINCPSAANE
jgi:hypothetical protein